MKGLFVLLSAFLVASAQQQQDPTKRCLIAGKLLGSLVGSAINSQPIIQQPPLYYPIPGQNIYYDDIFYPPIQQDSNVVYYYYDVYYDENGIEYIVVPDEIYYYYNDVSRKMNKKFEGQRVAVRKIGVKATPFATKITKDKK